LTLPVPLLASIQSELTDLLGWISMTGEMECRALPELETVILGNMIWGVLPDSWASGSQLLNLKAVYLMGDNFIHALHQGEFRMLSPAPKPVMQGIREQAVQPANIAQILQAVKSYSWHSV
jgi:hypothetical protein